MNKSLSEQLAKVIKKDDIKKKVVISKGVKLATFNNVNEIKIEDLNA